MRESSPPIHDVQKRLRPGRPGTKIVATLGPASEDRIDELIAAGLSVARVNFSHGTPEDHRRRVRTVREASARAGRHVAILADIRGPKLRLSRFPEGRLRLHAGDRLVLREGSGLAAAGELLFHFSGFLQAVEIGDRVFLADGAVELRIQERAADHLIGHVTKGGWIGDRKGVHLPDTELDLEVPTSQDREDLKLARELDVDMLGVSFVTRGDELREVKSLLPDAQIVAKIERAAALQHLEEIFEATDGIMVARGDLGVEIELEQIPMIQKSLLQASLKAGKFTITATEMLESMVASSRPTRAEVADVATAVLDGTDAVMLSAETAVGDHPVEAVATMARIARAVEASPSYRDLPRVEFRSAEPTASNAVALAAVEAADALELSTIVCFTESGATARLLSRYRPLAGIVALSPHEKTLRCMAVLAHVRPVPIPRQPNLESMVEAACEILRDRGLVQEDELVVIVAGIPPGTLQSTNMMKLHRV